jgi:hypothetical protein
MAVRLNLRGLQAEQGSQSAQDERGLEVSRRQALGIAGAAAVVATPAARVLESQLSGSFRLSTARGRAVFRISGREAWVIDPKHFGGSPKLHVDRAADLIRVRLSGATYPGTDISADLRAEIRSGVTGWRMTLSLGLARFQATVNFNNWLKGIDQLQSSALLRKRTLRISDDGSLTLAGEGLLTFAPNWATRFEGSHVAHLEGVGRASSGAVTIRLMEHGEKSLLSGATTRRTLVAAERGNATWVLKLPDVPTGSRLSPVNNGFDRIQIESRLARTGHSDRAFAALSAREGPAFLFHPSETIFGADRKPFGLPVRNACLAITSSGTATESVLTGSYHSEPAWMHLDTSSVLLGSDPRIGANDESVKPSEQAIPFVLHNSAAGIRLTCEPSILAVATGMRDAVVEPQPLTRPTRLEIVFDQPRRQRRPDTARLMVRNAGGHPGTPPAARSDAAHNLVIPNYVVSLLRPEDLLALRLEYYGFDLVVGGGNPPILARNADSAYMIAYFAPQNIAEEAYYELQPAGAAPNPNPDPGSGNETPDPPGTPARNIAGKSRLAFDINESVYEIPYSLLPVTVSIHTSGRRGKSRRAPVISSGPNSVLDWSEFTQRVVPVAQPFNQTSEASIAKPTTDQTSIEAPYRLMLSPNVYAFWNHTEELKPGPGGEVELWHTRLGVTDQHGNYYDDNDPTLQELRTVRAVWSPDYTPDLNSAHWPPEYSPSPKTVWNPYRASLDARDRYQLVRLTSDWTVDWHNNGRSGPYIPAPVDVTRLALSTLGAFMNVRGDWPDGMIPDSFDIVEWIHRATLARDQFVKVVYAGYLWPFGNKAVLIKITERKAVRVKRDGPLIAYLFQKFYIQVRQPTKTFLGENDGGTRDYPVIGTWPSGYDGREMSFKSVQITTLVTPDLADPTSAASSGDFSALPHPKFGGEDAFWPLILPSGSSKPTDFLWHLIGTDWDGNTTEFTIPLVFLSKPIAAAIPGTPPTNPNSGNVPYLNIIETAYTKSPKATVSMNGQKIAFAPSDPSPAANGTDPAVNTNTVVFNAAVVDNVTANDGHSLQLDQPQFFPRFARSNVEIPAIKHMLGTGATTWVAASKPFLQNGFDGNVNKGEIFLAMVDDTYLSLSDKSKQLGLIFGKGDNGQVVTPGTLSPNLSIAGLSRSIGPVGAALNGAGQSVFDTVAGGQFNPSDFLGDPSNLIGSSLPKLFGTISLTDILGTLPDFTQYLNKIPGLKVTRTDTEISVRYFWETEQINPWPNTDAGSPNEAILAPWVIDTDGSELLPMKNSKPRYTTGAGQTGDIKAPTLKTDSPPPPPDLAFPTGSNSDGVDGGGTDPTHTWVATYILDDSGTNFESVASLSNVLSMPDSGSDVQVTVQPSAYAKHGINIYRSKQGTAWPLYRITSGDALTAPTISAAQAMGSDPITITDTNSDSDIDGNSTVQATWMQFGIELEFTIPLDGSDPSYTILGEVAYASLQMDVIAVPFVNLTFKVESGAKLTVEARVNDVVFTGPLQFVNKLRDFLSAFGDPPFLDVSDTGIDTGYTLSIPTIAVGAFSLQNISLGAKITVPFFGDSVVVGFLFCSKENPFILTVYIFGGGGWFEIDIAPDGLIGVHAGLEFGVDCSLDIGIASGSVHVMAGIYFDYDKPSQTTSLTGFVDLGGSLDILGLISLSLDFHLQLTYTNDAGQSSVTGEAQLTVDVKVLFISMSVTLGPIKKTFGGDNTTSSVVHHIARHHGSDNQLPVGTMILPNAWAVYSGAFAD